MRFGEILHNLLEEHVITQKQLAVRLNIAASTLSGYVQNAREPDFETLKVFARYFHVSTDYLLGYSIEKETPLLSLENELLRVFRLLTEEQQHLYLEQGKVIVRINSKKDGTLLPPKCKGDAI